MPFATNCAYISQKVAQRNDRAFAINQATQQLENLQQQAGQDASNTDGNGADPSSAFDSVA